MLFFIIPIVDLTKYLIGLIKSDSSSQKQKKELKRQNSNVSKSDIAIDVNDNSVEDSPPETERKEAEVPVKKGKFRKFLKINFLWIS